MEKINKNFARKFLKFPIMLMEKVLSDFQGKVLPDLKKILIYLHCCNR